MTSKLWLPKWRTCLKITITQDLEVTVNRQSVREYLVRQRERYQKASKIEKGKILGEVVRVTGFHRKSAIRLLSGRRRESKGGRVGRNLRWPVDSTPRSRNCRPGRMVYAAPVSTSASKETVRRLSMSEIRWSHENAPMIHALVC